MQLTRFVAGIILPENTENCKEVRISRNPDRVEMSWRLIPRRFLSNEWEFFGKMAFLRKHPQHHFQLLSFTSSLALYRAIVLYASINLSFNSCNAGWPFCN